MQILNLGAGNRILEDAINHDRIKHRPEIDVAWDLNELPWPWADETFDKVVAISVLEHLRINLIESLDECWRVLRTGGVLYVKLPYWKHDHAYVDPTHYWRFSTHTIEMFDPETGYGRRYGFYTERKWKILKPARLNKAQSSFAATMEVRK